MGYIKPATIDSLRPQSVGLTANRPRHDLGLLGEEIDAPENATNRALGGR